MKILAGLGNPGKEYEHTRHNMGFDVIDILAKRWNVSAWKETMKAETAAVAVNGELIVERLADGRQQAVQLAGLLADSDGGGELHFKTVDARNRLRQAVHRQIIHAIKAGILQKL